MRLLSSCISSQSSAGVDGIRSLGLLAPPLSGLRLALPCHNPLCPQGAPGARFRVDLGVGALQGLLRLPRKGQDSLVLI